MHRHFATVCCRVTPECSEINWQHEEWAHFEYRD